MADCSKLKGDAKKACITLQADKLAKKLKAAKYAKIKADAASKLEAAKIEAKKAGKFVKEEVTQAVGFVKGIFKKKPKDPNKETSSQRRKRRRTNKRNKRKIGM
jgi:hypothetical protein|tara:strand:- start:5084 stop:5395 length:312 start_codon:yes stop_codon:yes gene_type:complete